MKLPAKVLTTLDLPPGHSKPRSSHISLSWSVVTPFAEILAPQQLGIQWNPRSKEAPEALIVQSDELRNSAGVSANSRDEHSTHSSALSVNTVPMACK